MLYNTELLKANFGVTQEFNRLLHDGTGALIETGHQGEEKSLDQRTILSL